MRDWIVVGFLYVLGMTFFHVLGGLGAAAEAFRRWGGASSTEQTRPAASS